MSASDQLKAALNAVDSNRLIAEFVGKDLEVNQLATSCGRLALWANSISSCESNLASPFLFEMQRASHDVALLTASALYVPAAASMRAVCETALYYTYFRSHPVELSTLANRADYYVSKNDILDFHKDHSPVYRRFCGEFGYPGNLNTWYSRVSAIVHGQLPGTWGQRLALQDVKHDVEVLPVVLDTFTEGTEIVHNLLLLTVGSELWGRFHHKSKSALLKGLPPDRRQNLGLDGKH